MHLRSLFRSLPLCLPRSLCVSLSLSLLFVWAELTVPQERRIPNAALSKTRRYSELKTWLQIREWIVQDYTVEVGALGFIDHSFRRFLSSIGIVSHQLKFVLNRISTAARRSSFYLWNARYVTALSSTPATDLCTSVPVSSEPQAPIPSVSPALVFLRNKINTNRNERSLEQTSSSSSDPLIPPVVNPNTSSTLSRKKPPVAPSCKPSLRI